MPFDDNRMLLEALLDLHVFGSYTAGPSWRAWRAFFYAALGVVPDDPELRAIILRCTGRSRCPTNPAREIYLVVGRRGGKDRIASILVALVAAFRDYAPYLAPGECATVMVIASDRKQARVVFRYIRALFLGLPMLKDLLAEEPCADRLELKNGVSIEIHTAAIRSVRGYTLAAAVLDELAHWRVESDAANPDTEIVNSLRPAMATIPGSLLIGISTPYARRGQLWNAYHKYFGVDEAPVLVWQADSRTMNPATVDEAEIATAYEDDPISATAEYGAEFRRDLEQFVSREVIEAAVMPDRRELPSMAAYRYTAFVDPSGGSVDSFTLAIGHREKTGRVVLDLLREVTAPLEPNAVTAQFCETLRRYGITQVTGDRYAGEWPRERFRAFGIEYRVSDLTKSEIYRECLPMLNSGNVELLDHAVLRAQLLSLERKTGRGGKDTIDHPPRKRDDVANAAAGVIVELEGATRSTALAALKATNAEYNPSRRMLAEERAAREAAEAARRWGHPAPNPQDDQLRELVGEFGSTAVTAIRRRLEPDFALPPHLENLEPGPRPAA